MGGSAWDPKKQSDAELFQQLVIDKNEYYDLPPTLEEYIESKGPCPGSGMYARWSWYIKNKKEYEKIFLKK